MIDNEKIKEENRDISKIFSEKQQFAKEERINYLNHLNKDTLKNERKGTVVGVNFSLGNGRKMEAFVEKNTTYSSVKGGIEKNLDTDKTYFNGTLNRNLQSTSGKIDVSKGIRSSLRDNYLNDPTDEIEKVRTETINGTMKRRITETLNNFDSDEVTADLAIAMQLGNSDKSDKTLKYKLELSKLSDKDIEKIENLKMERFRQSEKLKREYVNGNISEEKFLNNYYQFYKEMKLEEKKITLNVNISTKEEMLKNKKIILDKMKNDEILNDSKIEEEIKRLKKRNEFNPKNNTLTKETEKYLKDREFLKPSPSYDPKSGMSYWVLKNEETKTMDIFFGGSVFEGTDVREGSKNGGDAKNDIKASYETPENYKAALKIAKYFKEKYPEYKLNSAVGYSKGGGEAMYVASNLDIKCIAGDPSPVIEPGKYVDNNKILAFVKPNNEGTLNASLNYKDSGVGYLYQKHLSGKSEISNVVSIETPFLSEEKIKDNLKYSKSPFPKIFADHFVELSEVKNNFNNKKNYFSSKTNEYENNNEKDSNNSFKLNFDRNNKLKEMINIKENENETNKNSEKNNSKFENKKSNLSEELKNNITKKQNIKTKKPEKERSF